MTEENKVTEKNTVTEENNMTSEKMVAADRAREIERSIIKRFRKEIWRPFVKALNEYDMIKSNSTDGDVE